MSFLDLDKLENLKELRNLDEMEKLDKLDNLQQMPQMEHLDKLDNLQQMPQMEHLDKLDNLQQMDKLDNLKNLDQLEGMQTLNQLQNLDMLKHMQSLGQLYRLEHLEQLKLLNRMDELEKLNKLQSLQNLQMLKQMNKMNHLDHLDSLNRLPELSKLQHMDHLQSLDKLGQLSQLNRLQVIDRALGFNYNSLLLTASIIVPGFVFLEAFSLFFKNRLMLRHSIMIMLTYNVINFLICILLVYSHLNHPLFLSHPVVFCISWFAILLLIPAVLGAFVALMTRRPSFKTIADRFSPVKVMSAWDRFLTEAESYTVTITLNNEEKLQGIFRRGMPTPATADPNDLFFTETSHMEPEGTEWKPLDHPVGVWVKGSEIKFMEVTPLEERHLTQ